MATSPHSQHRVLKAISGVVALCVIALVVIVITATSASGPGDEIAFVGDLDATTTTTVASPPPTVGPEAEETVAETGDEDVASVPPEYLDGEPDHLQPSLTDDESIFELAGVDAIGYPTTTTAPAPTTAPSSGGGGTTPPPTTSIAGPPPPDPPPPAGSTVALGLGASNTGVVGGQNSGVCSNDLRELNGAITINDNWLDNENGGSRTLENFDLSGNIVVATDNVTLRCGRVSGNANYSIENDAKGLKLEWIEANQTSDGKTILGGNYTAYRCNVYGGEDSIHVNTGSVTVTECYIHDQNYIGGDPHPDAIQATSGGQVQSLTIVRSKLISFYKAPNAALQINVANSWSITDSYLWGGVYSILGDPGNPGTVTNNYFGWDSSQSGAIGGVNATKSGNVWWEWLSPKCSGSHSATSCETPSDHPGNGTPI